MPHPVGLPELFLDRSVGRIKVPQLLRAHGLRLVTLAEHYGVPADENVADVAWLRLVGERRWLAVMKDDRIRYVPAERQALLKHRVRAVVLTNANLSSLDMAERIIRAVPSLADLCSSDDGPFLCAIHARRIELIPLS